jgi:hypothetical protein
MKKGINTPKKSTIPQRRHNSRPAEGAPSNSLPSAQFDQKDIDFDLRTARAMYEFHNTQKRWRNHCEAVKEVRRRAKQLKRALEVSGVREALARKTVPLSLESPARFAEFLIAWTDKELAPKQMSKLEREMEPFRKRCGRDR